MKEYYNLKKKWVSFVGTQTLNVKWKDFYIWVWKRKKKKKRFKSYHDKSTHRFVVLILFFLMFWDHLKYTKVNHGYVSSHLNMATFLPIIISSTLEVQVMLPIVIHEWVICSTNSITKYNEACMMTIKWPKPN